VCCGARSESAWPRLLRGRREADYAGGRGPSPSPSWPQFRANLPVAALAVLRWRSGSAWQAHLLWLAAWPVARLIVLAVAELPHT
jgi:hypothetical protein